jgi:hypothetical protein
MPMHDWTQVEAGTFHAFHLAWLGELQKSLNGGVLPPGYYALAEQRAGDAIPDVLGLHESDPDESPAPEPTGGVATLTKTKPRVEQRLTGKKLPNPKGKRRTLTVRHTTGHRIIAFVEIVSPANKDRMESVYDFGTKVIAALRSGIHVLLVDPFPPGSADPLGMHGTVWRRVASEKVEVTEERPLAFASYRADRPVEAFVNHLAVGDDLPDMPLFLSRKKYIDVPLEATYSAAYAGMPAFWRKVLEKKPA